MGRTLARHEEKSGLSACAIKYIAVLAMLIDHIAWCFVDTYSLLGMIMHMIGRVTAPVMTYFIAEGFYYTRNVNKYLLRLGIFALISYIPYLYMDFGQLTPVVRNKDSITFLSYQGVIYTFFLTVLALKTVHTENLNGLIKGVIVFLLCIASRIGDWYCFPIVWALLFDRYRGSFKKQAEAFTISSVIMVSIEIFMFGEGLKDWFQYAVLLALIPLYFYNGKRG
ncbi:MAG: TraX family protein, partial [Oscillospiraceae bacterium]